MAPNMTAEETNRMENALEKLSMMRAGLNPNSDVPIKFNAKDENDENYLLDTLQEKKTPQEQKKLDQRINEQKRIDDLRIAVVYEALSKGVELKDNELYKEMLEQYPYYQKRLSERKQAIERLRRQAKVSKQLNQDIADIPKAKYKFE